MANKKQEATNEITIMEINRGQLDVCILGTSPLIYNAMSEKAKHELLMPAPKKNAAERAANLKHRPYDEYRNSVYTSRDPNGTTLLNFPAAAFKKAMSCAALDIPGVAKSQIGRLVWAIGDRVEIFGEPQMMCSIVRSADMNRTPDVRTRAILPEWACRVSFCYMVPLLKQQTIVNLLAAAGFLGVGDWRQERGSGSYGQFQLVSNDHPDFVRICKTMKRDVQKAALEATPPKFYDDETAKLITWFDDELSRRGHETAPAGKNGKLKKGDEAQA
jgi:hypothetical protein